jgi:hypothetical protein
MDALAELRWAQAFPWLTETRQSRQLRRLLEVAEVSCLTSASQLRAVGKGEQAARAEHFAAHLRLRLEQPDIARWLHTASRSLRDAPDTTVMIESALADGLGLMAADRGNVQVFDPATGTLRVVAEVGFEAEFLEYFAVVKDSSSACGRAAHSGQTVITDVTLDPEFSPHRDIAAASGFRAVQSTPLTDLSGQLRGVLSTHYPIPYEPPRDRLLAMSIYGQLIAEQLRSVVPA